MKKPQFAVACCVDHNRIWDYPHPRGAGHKRQNY